MAEYTYYLTLKVSNEEIYLKEFVQKTFSAIWLAMVSNLHDVPENITMMIVKKDGEKIEIKTNDVNLKLGDYVLKIINNQIDALLNSLNDIPKGRNPIEIVIGKI